MESDHHVLDHCHPGEELDVLEGPGDAALDDQLRPDVEQALTLEVDAP